MAKDPAMLFYTSDFLTGVALMSMKERGQYITLLCLQQQRGHMTEKEMRKAVGNFSDEVRSKFTLDSEGKLFNLRAEKEIAKRAAHCRKQADKAALRWGDLDMPRDKSGISRGIATAMPLENEKENRNNNPTVISDHISKRSNVGEEGGYKGGDERDRKSRQDQALTQVMSHYCDVIDPLPSTICMRELADFTERLGSDIVIHAIDIARDHIKGRANWSYIRGILRSYMKEGIKTLADAFQREQEFDEATDRHGGKNQQPQRKSFAELADELDKREGRS